MRRTATRAVIAAAAATVAAGLAATTVLAKSEPGGGNAWPYAPAGPAPVLVTVGDIACQPDANNTGPETGKPGSTCTVSGSNLRNQAMAATANEVEAMHPSLVAVLGDEQYQVGTYADFEGSFDKTYGAFKFLQRPAPGNHEFYDEHGEKGDGGVGYFDYYNGLQLDPQTGQLVTASDPSGNYVQPVPRSYGQAGQAGQGWYSYNLGSWHIISLNVECAVTDPSFASCANMPAWFGQETQWLSQDLSGDHAACTLVYWHQPSFSASGAPASATQPGPDGPEGNAAQQLWWPMLYRHGVDVVLNGHEHLYARFAPMDASGNPDPRHGIRQFIVGTGGESLDSLYTDPAGNVDVPNLQAGQGAGTSYQNGQSTPDFAGAFEVMKMTLGEHGYTWDYESAAAPATSSGSPAWGSFGDSGAASCHGAPGGSA